LYCGQPIEVGTKIRYAPKLGAVHPGCTFAKQLRIVEDADAGHAA
jgi:hypothetical protein